MGGARGRGNVSCPWDSPGPAPEQPPSPATGDQAAGGDKPSLLATVPSSDSMAVVHPATNTATVTDLGQVELHLDTPAPAPAPPAATGTRKKSSSAILAEAEEEAVIVKKTSKSSEDTGGLALASAVVISELAPAGGQCEVFPAPDPLPPALSCQENTGKSPQLLLCVTLALAGKEGDSEGEVGVAEAGEAGENGCGWISQEVCPWEDE